MIRLLFIFLLIHQCSFAQTKSPDKLYRWLTYGYPAVEAWDAIRSLEPKWKIKLYAVAGCVVTQQLVDSAALENKKTSDTLKAIFGTDWQEKFHADIKAETAARRRTQSVADEQAFIRHLRDSLGRGGRNVVYDIERISDSQHIVKVMGIVKMNGLYEWKKIYTLNVNHQTLHVSR